MFKKQHPFEGNLRTLATAQKPISEQECVELLSHIPLFCELSRRELRKLVDAAVQRDYQEGSTIVQQGETGVGFYVLVSGRVLIQQRLDDDSDRALVTLGPGEIFGEMA